jgi:ring-1,2-phenylacetyl-CoA epoxidase subunit PaaA
MTDPLALDPVLAPAERSDANPAPAREHGEAEDAWFQRFEAHVMAGGKVEATDAMPDAYRTAVLRFVEMHANSELMGVLPEREWLMRAPTLRRKLALTAKVQDEVGHAQLLYRVAEDLGKPREAMFDDLLAGRTKFHNVFHYPTRTWADVGIIAWLVDAAAIVAQQALRDSSYAPYARTMRKICWEESVHIMHGRDIVVTMATGTPGQRGDLQDALDRWWGPLMQMHGPRSPRERDMDLRWRIKAKTSEELRQEFLTIYVPRINELGLVIPDPALVRDDDTGEWRYTEPDWDELRTVVTNHGPMSEARLAFRQRVREESAWVRDAVLGVPAAALPKPSAHLRPLRRPSPPRRSRSPGRSSARRRTAIRCAMAAASWPPMPSWPSTTPASCSGAARRVSACGSCAAPTSWTWPTRTSCSRRSIAPSRSPAAT